MERSHLRTVLAEFARNRTRAHLLMASSPAPWGPYTVTAMGDDYVVAEGTSPMGYTRKFYLAIAHIAGVWEADPVISVDDVADPDDPRSVLP